ncbi:MAG: enoyl-CoA hydratase/isomerase family protein [Actinomycetota bacterium]|nr:enoyl-CoA hydratase/isomerase family protein [Actinomycetota bacterium]
MSDVLLSFEDRPSGRVAHVTLNRPELRNAITIALGRGLQDALSKAAVDADVIVIRGAGGNFSAGGDLHEVSQLRAQGVEAMRPLFDNWVAACELIATLPVPVVAAVEGYALAGGFELLSSVDICLVRDDAVLADNHVNFGILPSAGGSQRLPRLVGLPRAMGHVLTGERISGKQAELWGLAYRSVPAEEFEAAILALVDRLAALDGQTLATTKHLMRTGLSRSLADGLAMEVEATLAHLANQDAAVEGIAAFTRRGGT